jgi:hypothetical protein
MGVSTDPESLDSCRAKALPSLSEEPEEPEEPRVTPSPFIDDGLVVGAGDGDGGLGSRVKREPPSVGTSKFGPDVGAGGGGAVEILVELVSTTRFGAQFIPS